MHLPKFMRRVNRVVTNPILGSVAWILPPLAIVHHVGRKTGKRYRTPVVAFATASGFVIPMTYGRDVDWGRNLVHAGGGEIVQIGQRHVLRRPRMVDRDTAYPHLPIGIRSALWKANLPGYVLLDTVATPIRSAASKRKRPE